MLGCHAHGATRWGMKPAHTAIMTVCVYVCGCLSERRWTHWTLNSLHSLHTLPKISVCMRGAFGQFQMCVHGCKWICVCVRGWLYSIQSPAISQTSKISPIIATLATWCPPCGSVWLREVVFPSASAAADQSGFKINLHLFSCFFGDNSRIHTEILKWPYLCENTCTHGVQVQTKHRQ